MKQTLWTVGVTSLLLANAGYSQDMIEENEDGGVETIIVTGDRPGVGAGANPGVVIGGPGTISGAGGSGGAGGGGGIASAPKKTKPEQQKANDDAKKKIADKTITDKSLISEFLDKARQTITSFGSRFFQARGRLILKPDGTQIYEGCAAFKAGQAANDGKDYCSETSIREFDMPDGTKMLRFHFTPIKAPCAQYDARFDAIFWSCTPEGAFEFYGKSIEEIEQALGAYL